MAPAAVLPWETHWGSAGGAILCGLRLYVYIYYNIKFKYIYFKTPTQDATFSVQKLQDKTPDIYP